MKVFAFFLIFAVTLFASEKKQLILSYEIDVRDIASDSFHVSLNVDGITTDSIVFQFATTQPGTYQTMDVGRFVGSFRANDKGKKALNYRKINVNQIIIYDAQKLSQITYSVEDTYDTKIQEMHVLSCAGSNIEQDNAVINGQMVCGYFHGYQDNPISISFKYPKSWKIGTALLRNKTDYYADNYDQLVDSPVMLGDLTVQRFNISNTTIEVYCYSQNRVINAEQLADTLRHIVKAVEQFLGELPVSKYVFLFHFRKEIDWWALEHNYSSYYATPEASVERLKASIASVATHEFCHIVTPLHIHSDIIEKFNFEKPIASRHLWFYEGITDWMAEMALVRGGLISEETFLKHISGYRRNYSESASFSLIEGSLGCYDKYQDQWYDAYAKGALVGMLIDINLLETSSGKIGLAQVMKQLLKEYDTKHSFDDRKFFDVFEKATNSNVRSILNKYVADTSQLPLADFMGKLGYDYTREFHTGKWRGYHRKWDIETRDNRFFVSNPDEADSLVIQLNIKSGDQIKGVRYREVDIGILTSRFYAIRDSIQVGEPIAWIVERDGRELILNGTARREEIIEKHKITPRTGASEEQLFLRKKWLTNLHE